MAYRDPQPLACPGCDRTGDLVWLVGEGPNTRPGEGPAYTDIADPGPWIVQTDTCVPKWRGRITCPVCGADLLVSDASS